MLNDLISIADVLDAKGFHLEAEEIDTLIHQATFNVKNIQDLITVLKNTFSEAINNPGLPYITKESLPNIFTVLDAVGGKIQIPVSGKGTSEQILALQDRSRTVAEGILNLDYDIKKLELKLSVSGSNEKIQLQRELDHDHKLLDGLWTEANRWKTGKRKGDKEKWQNLQALLMGRGR